MKTPGFPGKLRGSFSSYIQVQAKETVEKHLLHFARGAFRKGK